MAPVRDGWILTAMLTSALTTVIVNTLVKSVTSKGFSPLVVIVYSYGFGSLLLLPLSFFSFKSTSLPPLTFSALYKMCLLGLIVSVCQIASYNGIKYSSTTLSSAISNVTPAFTFIFAVIFRMEIISLNKKSSIAKILGTIMSIIGAVVATLYHGPLLFLTTTTTLISSDTDWVFAGALFIFKDILFSISYLLMAHTMVQYPSAVIVTFVHNVCIFVVCGLVTIFVERNNPKAWIIGFHITFIKIITVGLLNSGYYIAHTWAIRYKGPVYLSMFLPLTILITAASSSIFLGESFYLGILIGGILITIGFYMVLWGKAKEEIESSSSQKEPLLVN